MKVSGVIDSVDVMTEPTLGQRAGWDFGGGGGGEGMLADYVSLSGEGKIES